MAGKKIYQLDANGAIVDTQVIPISATASGDAKKETVANLSTKIRDDIVVGDIPTAIPATSIADGSVSNAEFQYISTVTSNVQTQLDGKSATGHTHVLATGATDVTSSAAELNILDGATLTVTELNYVDGVTSSIQTQLDAKLTSSSISDTVYGAGWDGDTTHAPTKNAVYDKIESLVLGGGTGDVTKVGTPVDNQIGVWTGDGTIEGDSAFTFDTTANTLTLTGTENITGQLNVDNVRIDGNTISATNVNGIIDLTSNGTGGAFLTGVSGNMSLSLQGTTYTFTNDVNNDYYFSGGAQYGILDFSSIATSDKTFTFPNTTGTVALTANPTDITVPDEAYGVGWNGSLEVPTKNALYDKIETIAAGGITRTVVVTSGSLTLGATAATDYLYFVAGAHTLSMPSPNTNRYSIKNNHSANITVDTAGAELIEGAASISIAPEESVDVVSDGTNRFII